MGREAPQLAEIPASTTTSIVCWMRRINTLRFSPFPFSRQLFPDRPTAHELRPYFGGGCPGSCGLSPEARINVYGRVLIVSANEFRLSVTCRRLSSISSKFSAFVLSVRLSWSVSETADDSACRRLLTAFWMSGRSSAIVASICERAEFACADVLRKSSIRGASLALEPFRLLSAE